MVKITFDSKNKRLLIDHQHWLKVKQSCIVREGKTKRNSFLITDKYMFLFIEDYIFICEKQCRYWTRDDRQNGLILISQDGNLTGLEPPLSNGQKYPEKFDFSWNPVSTHWKPFKGMLCGKLFKFKITFNTI